jgi:hypothetical protein
MCPRIRDPFVEQVRIRGVVVEKPSLLYSVVSARIHSETSDEKLLLSNEAGQYLLVPGIH